MEGLECGGFMVPGRVRDYLRGLGFSLPLDPMEEWVQAWDGWMAARGAFYDYRDTDGFGRRYEVHRRTLMPAMRVCREWGSLLLNDKTAVVCGEQACTDWLAGYFAETGFLAQAQACLVRAFGLGTGAWALWAEPCCGRVRVRGYDARMVVPLSWDVDGVSECAFVTRAFLRGRAVDQLQMHLRGDDGRYRIETVCFDDAGVMDAPAGVISSFETGSAFPTFAMVRPAIENTRVDFSPYGQSIFADAVDAVQAVDLAFDALFNEVDVSKMRIFLSDVMFEREGDGRRGASIPFGRQDCTVFRKVMSTEDTIQEFAPALRTDSQVQALRVALQMLGDLCGFGIGYFDFDNSGYVKTATEVSSDNSALMRNIRRHEHALEASLVQVCRALLAVERGLGAPLPEEGSVRVDFDDSIITDTAAEKAQDMVEVGVVMQPWEYRAKWYGEDEATARAGVRGLEGARASASAAVTSVAGV